MLDLYSPLDSSKDEIRLITLLRKLQGSATIRALLETHSLGSVLPCSRALHESRTDLVSGKSSRREAICETQHGCRIDQAGQTCPRFTWGDYIALSYVWGDDLEPVEIEVNGHQLQVTRNLAQALESFSRKSEFGGEVKLWVDAISINQKDFEERGLQVAKMRDIYRKASSVIAWVGEEENDSNSAIELVAEMSKYGNGTGAQLEIELRDDPTCLGTGCWLALREFMKRPYWYRLWIIQEIIVGSSSMVVRAGNCTIAWKDFCAGVAVLQEHLWVLKGELLAHDLTALSLSTLKQGWPVTSLHLVYRDLSPLSERDEAGELSLPFWKILDIANSAECRDPRDKVYGLVGLMHPDVTAKLTPNYTRVPQEVYTEAARAFIQTYENLEAIREGGVWGPTGTPSWVADWQMKGRVNLARIENTLWGPIWLSGKPVPNHSDFKPYNASGDVAYDICFPDDRLLACIGFIVDKISSLSARGRGYFAWDETTIDQRHSPAVYGDLTATSETLYRTLVADRVNGGRKAEPRHAAILSLPSTFDVAQPQFKRLGWSWLASQDGYYFRWAKWRAANENFVIGGRALEEYFTNEISFDASEYDFTEVYSCFDRTCQKRRFMLTEGGYMGWAPDNIYGRSEEQTKIGDLIAIIFGCSTPVVIRPRGSSFQVIGEAYVQGIMDGEALEFLAAGKLEVTRFTFC